MNSQASLFQYILKIADNQLILGHRLSEQCSKGPFLEEDIACSNIALDLIGAANSLYVYAAAIEGENKTEDDLVFLRSERAFKNVLLVEQPNTDFAYIMCRQFLFDTFDYFFQQALQKSKDETLAAIAAKTIKESTYHLRHSGNWIIRLGDGTPESNLRLKNAFANLWCYVEELFEQDAAELDLVAQGIALDTQSIKSQFNSHIAEIMQTAGMEIPTGIFMQSGGKKGVHTEHLGFLLAEMQSVHRSFPGVKW